MTTIPWSHTPRPDTQTTNARVGIWLFLASEAMLFGSLFSAYVLLRTGAPVWPDPAALNLQPALLMTPVLLAAAGALVRGRVAAGVIGGLARAAWRLVEAERQP